MAYPKHTTREERDAEVLRLYREGVPMPEIARRAGCVPGNIWHILAKAGEPRRPKVFRPRRFTSCSIGERIGRWTVIGFETPHGSVLKVRCDCGTEAVRVNVALRDGTSNSCGCGRVTHGERAHLRHSKEYSAWQAMKQRCARRNARFSSRYIERGITVCPEWANDFEAFLRDVGRAPSKEHSIDRINNNGNYEPGNVRWATRYEQGNNRETNIRLTFHGETKTVTEWAREAGLSPNAVQLRLKSGDTTKERLLRPSKQGKRGRK